MRLANHLAIATATTTIMAMIFIAMPVPSVAQSDPSDLAVINYTNFTTHVKYESVTEYLVRGMEPFYNITHQILKLFYLDELFNLGYEELKGQGTPYDNERYAELAKSNWPLLLVICLSVAVVVLTPIVGLCFCCCRCCGSCGGRTQPFDKKHDTCRRILYGLLLLCAGTAMIFGVVLAFMTNYYMQQGVEDITQSARTGIKDTTKFINVTSQEVDYLLVTNFRELSRNLEETLDSHVNVTTSKLEEVSHAGSLYQLNNFAQTLPSIRNDLARMKELSVELRTNASELNSFLRIIKGNLLQILKNCEHSACKDLEAKYRIGELDVSGIDYNKMLDRYFPRLPDVTALIDHVNQLISGDLMATLQTSARQVDSVKVQLLGSIDEKVQEVKDAINNAGKNMQSISYSIDDGMVKISDWITSQSNPALDTADDYINEYSKYRYYGGLAIASLLLLILLCITFGLLCGICGKRPDGYGDDCCNKGAGGRFLMIGVALIFLTLSVLVVITLAHFLVGAAGNRIVCIALKDPANDPLFTIVDDNVNVMNISAVRKLQSRTMKNKEIMSDNKKISQTIVEAQQNMSAYEVLGLHRIFNITQIKNFPQTYNIEELLNNLEQQVEMRHKMVVMDADTKNYVRSLGTSKLNDFDSGLFEQHLRDEITKYNLTEVSIKLLETAHSIPNEFIDIREQLQHNARLLKMNDVHLVGAMTRAINEVLNITAALDRTLKFGQPSFKVAIDKFVNEAESTERFFNEHGTSYVRQSVKNLTMEIMNKINGYIELIVFKLVNDVGRCEPLANVYKSLQVATCKKIVDPLNGFWAGVGWCLWLFLPVIIFSVKLSSLYQKSEPYPGPEAEYLYDAYSERENIPLANGPKNKRRKNYDRRREPRDYYEDSNSSYGGGAVPPSSSRDARYTDMAPNNHDMHNVMNNNNNNNRHLNGHQQSILRNATAPPIVVATSATSGTPYDAQNIGMVDHQDIRIHLWPHLNTNDHRPTITLDQMPITNKNGLDVVGNETKSKDKKATGRQKKRDPKY